MMHKNFLSGKSKETIFIVSLLVTFFASILFLTPKAEAVFVAPTEIFFDGGRRSAIITLSNRGKRTKIITFSWQHKGMTENGKMLLLESLEYKNFLPGYNPVNSYIRLSPRRVILKPGQHQRVRLLVQKPADLAAGEYRSHLFIQEENYSDETVEASESEQKSLSGQIILNISRSIPIFMRHGETNVNVSLNQARLIEKKGRPHLQLSFNNDSTRSIYGQVHVACSLADGTVKNMELLMIRIYAEGKNFVKDVPFGKQNNPQDCVSMTAKMVGKSDFALGNKEITETLPVQF